MAKALEDWVSLPSSAATLPPAASHRHAALDIYAAKLGEGDVELPNCRSAWASQEAEAGNFADAERLLPVPRFEIREASNRGDATAMLNEGRVHSVAA